MVAIWLSLTNFYGSLGGAARQGVKTSSWEAAGKEKMWDTRRHKRQPWDRAAANNKNERKRENRCRRLQRREITSQKGQ